MVKKYRRLQQPELTEYTLPLTRFQYIFSTHLLLLKMKDSTSITELTFRVLMRAAMITVSDGEMSQGDQYNHTAVT